MKRSETLKLLTVFIITLLATLNFLTFELKYSKAQPIAYNYVGDEVWYVSASRNILREVFHTYPPCSAQCNATVQFVNKTSELKFLSEIVPKLRISVIYNYTKVKNALYVEGPKNSIEDLIEHQDKYNISIVQPGWRYPEQQGILKYLNLEHPPLGKYFIALAIHEKDVPWMWREPGIILSTLAFFTLSLASYLVSRSLIMWIATLFLLYYDVPLRVMSMVAMLDIYAAAFSMMTLSTLPFSLFTSVILWSLAVSSKYTAAFYVLVLAYIFWRKGDGPLKALMKPSLVALIVFLILSIPLMMHLGPLKWMDEVLRGLSWFTVSRPTGPPPASPLDWIEGKTPSPLYIKPSLYVITNSIIMKLAILSFFLLYPLKDKKEYKLGWLASFFLVSALVGFQMLYLKGNRTLYTFYTVVFTPMADVASAGFVVLLANFNDLSHTFAWWISTLKELSKWLWGTKKLKCELITVKVKTQENVSEKATSENEQLSKAEDEL